MRTFTTSILACFALVGIACSDGSGALSQTSGSSSTTSTGASGDDTTTGTPGSGGSSVDPTGTGGGSETTGMGGMVTGSGGMTSGAGGTGMPAPDSGVVTQPDSGGGTAGHTGPFKMLMLSKTLEFAHDSIMTGQVMLADLGKTPDAMLPQGATKGSQFTTVLAKDDLSDFTEANLKNYEIIFWMNPTGTVFSSGGANGVVAMAAIQKFMETGGAWAGVHSATDFEKTSKWNWFHDQVDGAFFTGHDGDGTPGTVVTQAAGMSHPAMRGVTTPWNTQDEWYFMSRNVETLTGYTVLAKLNKDQRPVVWTHDMATGGGRSFYTIRGHNKTVYAEPDFRKLVHQGILWATHRMQ